MRKTIATILTGMVFSVGIALASGANAAPPQPCPPYYLKNNLTHLCPLKFKPPKTEPVRPPKGNYKPPTIPGPPRVNKVLTTGDGSGTATPTTPPAETTTVPPKTDEPQPTATTPTTPPKTDPSPTSPPKTDPGPTVPTGPSSPPKTDPGPPVPTGPSSPPKTDPGPPVPTGENPSPTTDSSTVKNENPPVQGNPPAVNPEPASEPLANTGVSGVAMALLSVGGLVIVGLCFMAVGRRPRGH